MLAITSEDGDTHRRFPFRGHGDDGSEASWRERGGMTVRRKMELGLRFFILFS